MEISLPESSSDVLAAKLVRESTQLVLTLNGAADLRVEKHFETVLNAVHEQTQRTPIRGVTVDLQQLNFINSACLKSLVVWISDVRGLGDEGYLITFLQNPSISWQQRSLSSLKAFGEESVAIK
jgi:hypothetical protein